ncbi:MAG: ATP-binding cassette domain-containing protein, partial [Agrobacterium sp.]|uniref:ATP-binding cassette domain-containing protein n=1 Tax=Agrobacterium sp. TaxID=361 RepID=UPI004033B5A5
MSDVERGVAVKGDVLLELDNVSGQHKPENVSLTLHRGEVLGLAGLLGSGRSSLARVMAGIDPVAKGEIRIKGRAVSIRKPADAIAAGVALVPEARATQGIIPDHSVASNMILAVIDRLSAGGPIVGVGAGIATGLAVGMFNGWLTTRIGIPSFLTTLAMMGIAKGVAMWIS